MAARRLRFASGRTSVDFDFFSDVPLDDDAKGALLGVLQEFGGVSVLQNARNTLTASISRDDEPVKLSFFGGISNGRVGEPEKTDDDVLCVASLDDLLAHKLKVIHDRAEGKDYQDIAAMLAAGQNLAHGLAAVKSLFGPAVPAMITLKALSYFDDANESWRVTEDVKTTIFSAIEQLPARWSEAPIISYALGCICVDQRDARSGPDGSLRASRLRTPISSRRRPSGHSPDNSSRD